MRVVSHQSSRVRLRSAPPSARHRYSRGAAKACTQAAGNARPTEEQSAPAHAALEASTHMAWALRPRAPNERPSPPGDTGVKGVHRRHTGTEHEAIADGAAAYHAPSDRVVHESVGALMGRRIRWLGVIMVVCLGLVVAQLVNIQLVKAKQLQTSPNNPQVAAQKYSNPRGIDFGRRRDSPRSVGTNAGGDQPDGVSVLLRPPVSARPAICWDHGIRLRPLLRHRRHRAAVRRVSGAHQQPPQTLSQLIFRQSQPTITDNVTLTVQPKLQQAAWSALDQLAAGREQGRGGRGDSAVDWEHSGHGLESDLRPESARQPFTSGGAAGLSQLYGQRPRGLPVPATDRHWLCVSPRFHDEGRHEHRRVQPQAQPGGLRLPRAAMPDIRRRSGLPALRPVRAVRRDDDAKCCRSRATRATPNSGCNWASPS